MNKRFLNKKIDSSLLKQSLPENVLQKSRSGRQTKKTEFVTNYNSSGSEWQPGALRSSKLDKIRQAETRIVQEFVQKESQLNLAPKETAEKDILLLLSIEQIRSMLVSKRVEKQAPSELRDQLLESRKIRFLYGGLSKRELKRSIKRARQLLGSAADNLLIVLESRLDVALERCGFFSSIRLARQSIVHARVKVNQRIVKAPGYWLQPGDVIQVKRLKQCFVKIGEPKSESNLLTPANLTAAQTLKLREQSVFFRNESSVNLSSSTSTNLTKEAETSISAHKRTHSKQSLILNSLLELECLFSNICLQTTQLSFTLPFSLRNRLEIDRVAHARIPCTNSVHYPCTDACTTLALPRGSARVVHGISARAQSALHRLHTSGKTFLRLNRLIKASELYLSIQNKANFSNLFVKEFTSNGSFKRNNTSNIALSVKIFGSILKSTTPHLALHVQQVLQKEKTVSTTAQKPDVLISKHVNQQDCMPYANGIPNIIAISDPKLYYPLFFKEKQQQDSAAFTQSDEAFGESFDDTFYHVYFYWLQLAKILLSLSRRDSAPVAREQFLRQDRPSAKNRIVSFQYRKIKPLHLEVSYQGCNAIFLYPPQRVYLPALVNVDLLVKVL